MSDRPTSRPRTRCGRPNAAVAASMSAAARQRRIRVDELRTSASCRRSTLSAVKPCRRPRVAEHVEIAPAAGIEPESVADHDRAGGQGADEDVADEVGRGRPGQPRGEFQDEDGVDPVDAGQFGPSQRGGQRRGVPGRPGDGGGMPIEGDHDGREVEPAGPFDRSPVRSFDRSTVRPFDRPGVPTVHAVEHADGDDARSPPGRISAGPVQTTAAGSADDARRPAVGSAGVTPFPPRTRRRVSSSRSASSTSTIRRTPTSAPSRNGGGAGRHRHSTGGKPGRGPPGSLQDVDSVRTARGGFGLDRNWTGHRHCDGTTPSHRGRCHV